MELIAESVCVARGPRVLVEALDLTLSAGSICVILGPNGAGKSSLLLCLAGLIAPRAGEVRVDGQPVSSWSPGRRAQRIAWQGDLPTADFGFTVQERLRVTPPGRRDPSGALAKLDLGSLRERRLTQLSTGERQRVELAALWLRDAPVWLLDEPTAHLDLRHQIRWLEILQDEAARGRTIIVALHDLSQAHAIADRAVALVGDGQARVGSVQRILQPSLLQGLYGVRVQRLSGEDAEELLPVYPNRSTRGESP